ncbi:branched-chain amino acid transport system II carrier protein [Romboutsia lituseburensis]|uniref:Branched-chain amino acid transport system carrier protein n=1 Tax=Romboutsia lituseburensis DSM 797 TaxID=1121325 RepID=A0A1G9Q5N3_9FIRM|nr:branched-chain amino acid transport system II carrier protein [Romboutsia lituseburensis]CEH35336.1 Branched-chain amino acid transport system 2 carrier protein [Romboutsia lituseburensis]SDM05797.1 branched-chain amino acid:cation transporter, LIVCS family [Romboutsia lituseburensis DSM 797]
MNKTNKDIVIVGFALFAMFFGAGNLIFPPFLGVISGESWLTGFGGFLLADVGLALLAVAAAAKCNGEVSKVLGRAGKNLAIVLGSAIMICLGPLLAIPRTAATTFEMGISPLASGFNPILFSVLFFAITFILTIKPSKVVDIIGQFLTPALLVALGVLIIKGIVTPLGDINPTPMINDIFAEGVKQGYQTMDALGAVALSTVIITSLANKGYNDESQKVKLTMKAGIVAAIGLCLVYGGLTYLGATVSQVYGKDVVQTKLIVEITASLLGHPGKIILALIVGLACLTTAIGLTSATAQFFSKITNGKLKYEIIVTAVCIFSAIVSNFGVSTIIKFSAPILDMIYPATVVLVIMTLFGSKIKNDNAFKGAAYMALLVSVLTVANNLGISIPMITKLPFAQLGFNWIVPVLIGGVVGSFIPSHSKQGKIDINRVG